MTLQDQVDDAAYRLGLRLTALTLPLLPKDEKPEPRKLLPKPLIPAGPFEEAMRQAYERRKELLI